MPRTVKISELSDLVGRELEPSSWMEMTQERVNQFANATDDYQYIHVDPEKAAESPFGGTIAHGFLTLSLIPYLAAEHARVPEGLVMAVNYGSDKVRFIKPVRVGDRIRLHQKILEFKGRKMGQYMVRTEYTVEIENSKKAALTAELISLLVT